ncbi:cyclase family protein [Tumebacillus sp. ITR2]|uniref:Kynurenine formamidase n=1 Tax=Tumebacillus amylolyticus TaxID=2801339 RepID=A0ABS1J506_9BACL|nr:cyclase family protein [Tumebacillus amylolyticus]MBL0385360.1 cyclase family protein [Tumebacillus amylolyticus]
MKKIYDITMSVTAETAPFPGDTPFSLEWVWTMEMGGSCNVSRIVMSPHVGTHGDSPYHYGSTGGKTEEVPLDVYVGEALVVNVPRESGALISREFVEDVMKKAGDGVTRVLFKTDSYPDHTVFNTDFTAIAPEAVLALADLGVRLIGMDTPSVDPADSKTLDAHGAFLQRGVYILENLRLHEVPAGRYELIALPMKIEGSCAAPVRAILRSL